MHTAAKQEALGDTVAAPDPFTVGSIGILAYMLGNVLQEGVGHGGVCLLVGAKPLVLSSVHFECSLDSCGSGIGGRAPDITVAPTAVLAFNLDV
jgi:hypothetical protein